MDKQIHPLLSVRWNYSSIAKLQRLKIWEWMTNFILHFIGYVVTYPCWDYSYPVLIGKGGQEIDGNTPHASASDVSVLQFFLNFSEHIVWHCKAPGRMYANKLVDITFVTDPGHWWIQQKGHSDISDFLFVRQLAYCTRELNSFAI